MSDAYNNAEKFCECEKESCLNINVLFIQSSLCADVHCKSSAWGFLCQRRQAKAYSSDKWCSHCGKKWTCHLWRISISPVLFNLQILRSSNSVVLYKRMRAGSLALFLSPCAWVDREQQYIVADCVGGQLLSLFPVKLRSLSQLFDVELMRRFVWEAWYHLNWLIDDETDRRLNGNIQRSFLLICVIRPVKETSAWFLCIGSNFLFYELSVCRKCCHFSISLTTYRATCALLISPSSRFEV